MLATNYLAVAPPPGIRMHWEHEIHLPMGEVLTDRQNDPVHVEMAINGNTIGVTRHAGFAVTRDGEAEARQLIIDRRFHTPLPQTSVTKMLSETIRGRFPDDAVRLRGQVPVIDEMQVHEDLLVWVHATPLGDQIYFDVGGMSDEFEVLEIQRTKKELFQARLRPILSDPHTTKGAHLLVVLGDIVLEVPMPLLRIKSMADTTDYGYIPKISEQKPAEHGRPADLDNAIQHYQAALDQTYENRKTEVEIVLQHSNEKDPPVQDHSISAKVMKACLIALNAVTAGFAAHLAGTLKLASEGTEELVKVLLEESMGEIKELRGSVAATASAPITSIRGEFLRIHAALLSSEKSTDKRGPLTRTRENAKLLNLRDAGQGTAAIMRLTKNVDKSLHKVTREQLVTSFDALNSLIANFALRSLSHVAEPTDLDLLAGGLAAFSIVSRPDRRYGYYGPKASDVQALLRLEFIDDDTKPASHKLRVYSAAVNGLTAAQRAYFQGRNIKDIHSPIVGRYTRVIYSKEWGNLEEDKSWEIGKNQSNVVALSNESRSLEVRTGKPDPVSAARAIFETIGECPLPNP